MLVADRWKDYKVLDTSGGEKLEDFGGYQLIRPDPQVIWYTEKRLPGWKKPNAHYHRSQKGGGSWEFFDLPKQWQISYELPPEKDSAGHGPSIVFNLKPFSFKHTGVFPEQAVNWDRCSLLIRDRMARTGEAPRVLNLFAYTGGATMAAAASGARLTHVDSSKGMVTWAKENAHASGLEDAPIRYLVDDCTKFVERELRRGNSYDAVIMDPPSYGRGPKGEIWKIEDDIYDFIKLCGRLLSDDPLFFLVNSYTTGLQAGVLTYMLDTVLTSSRGGHTSSDEIGLPVGSSGLILPCGAAGLWTAQRPSP